MHLRHILYQPLLWILMAMAGLLLSHSDGQSQETPAADQARPANAGTAADHMLFAWALPED